MGYREHRESLYQELEHVQSLIDNLVVDKKEVLSSVLSTLKDTLFYRLILLGLNDKEAKNIIKTVTLYQVTRTTPITIRPYSDNKPLFSIINKSHKKFIDLDYHVNDALFEHDIIDLMNNQRSKIITIKVN